MKKTTVAILGDCGIQISVKDIPHTRAVGLLNWLSIVSSPLPQVRETELEDLDDCKLSRYNKKICLLDAGKGAMRYLLEEKADYLLLDANDCRKNLLVAKDAPAGIWQPCLSDNSYMSDYGKVMQRIYEAVELRSVPCYEIPFAVYEQAAEHICAAILKHYRPEQIILVRHGFADGWLDRQGCWHKYLRNTSELNDRAAILMQQMEDLLVRLLAGCHVIGFPTDILGDPEHEFGNFPLHYHSLYYDYVRQALQFIFERQAGEKYLLENLRQNVSNRFRLLRLEARQGWQEKIFRGELDVLINMLGSRGKGHNPSELARLLRHQSDFVAYLDLLYLLREEIILLLAVRDTPGFYSDTEFLPRLRRLGFVHYPNQLWQMYVGIVYRGGALVDDAASEPEQDAETSCAIVGRNYFLQSQAYRQGDKAVISIDGNNHALNRRGVNLVVCSAVKGEILDTVSFDSHEGDLFARR